MVQVAGLGVGVAVAGEVLDAEFHAEGLERLAAVAGPRGDAGVVGLDLLIRTAVVEQEDLELAGGVADALGRRQRGRHDIHALVVGRHEDIDGRRIGRRHLGGARTVDRLSHSEQAEEQHGHTIAFRRDQDEAGRAVERRGERRDRAGEPPGDVAQHDEGAQREEDAPPGSTEPHGLDGYHREQRRSDEGGLSFHPERQVGQDQDSRRGDDKNEGVE